MIIMKVNASAEWTVSSAASESFTIGNTYTGRPRNEESPSLALYGAGGRMPGPSGARSYCRSAVGIKC
jgi:hypothetical protein